VISDFGERKMLEVSDEQGVPLDMPVVPLTKLEPASKHGA
jgi:hypothetical protein